MSSKILLIPVFEVFVQVDKSVDNRGINHNKQHQLFKECMIRYIDYHEKLIYISPEMKRELIERKLIPEIPKRLNLFQIIGVHPKSVLGDYFTSLIRLASLQVLETDYKVYVICDDDKLRESINKQDKLFTCITTETALVLLDNLKKKT